MQSTASDSICHDGGVDGVAAPGSNADVPVKKMASMVSMTTGLPGFVKPRRPATSPTMPLIIADPAMVSTDHLKVKP